MSTCIRALQWGVRAGLNSPFMMTWYEQEFQRADASSAWEVDIAIPSHGKRLNCPVSGLILQTCTSVTTA